MRALAHSDVVERLARAGYLTKGIVYGLVGALALLAAFGEGGALGGGRTAVRTIGEQPFGRALLIATGAGLFAYALWRFVQAVLAPEHPDHDVRSIGKRVAYAVSGAIYAGLGVQAFQMALGERTGGGAGFLGELWSTTAGRIAIGIGGAIVLLFAAQQLHRALGGEPVKHLRKSALSEPQREWIERIARIGIGARAVVFVAIGVGVVRAAIDYEPAEAHGVGGALREIAAQPFGVVLLVLIAIGLIAYGAYQVIEALYRRIPAR
jgi:hypothetical protein